MMRIIIWFISAIWLFPTLLSVKKDNTRFKHLSIEDGLSQISAYCILQDGQVFMWPTKMGA